MYRSFWTVVAEIMRSRVWIIPAISAVTAAAAAIIIILLEGVSSPVSLRLGIDPDSARTILSAISSAMISFTAVVFSVTMLILQLASSQLSPRVTRTFLRDRFNQSVLGLFVATFVFALLMLVTLEDGFVPGLGVIAAIGLVLAAVLAFVVFIDHVAHAIQPSSVIGAIAAETRAAIERNYESLGDEQAPSIATPAEPDAGPAAATIRWPHGSGYIIAIDEARLVDLATTMHGMISLSAGVGEYLVEHAPFAEVRDHAEGPHAFDASRWDAIASAVHVAGERTMSQDPAFGFRQLVDVALRALSPSLNDPTTASQVIDRIHDLLRHLSGYRIESPRIVRRDDVPRLVIPAPDWDAFIDVAIMEIHAASQSLPQVSAHLCHVLRGLQRDARPAHRPALRRALEHVEAT